MRKAVAILLLVLGAACAHAQQTAQYSQYMLNGYGYNPAAGGFSDEWEILAGRRTQWRGFENPPVTNFLSVHKSIAKKSFRNYWHGAGMYVEDDDAGMVAQRALYLSYTYHLRLAKRHTLSFGIFAGGRMHGYRTTIYDPNDPALALYPPTVLVGPEFIPGIRFRTKSLFADLSAKNLYKTKLKNGDKMLGTPSELKPHYYFTIGKKYVSKNYYYSFVPSMQVRYTTAALPAVDLNCMMYLKRRVGLGLSYRHGDAIVSILQVRITRTFVVGFAYDFVTSRIRNSASASQEIMLGFSPVAVSDYEPATNVAECPVMEF
jgi:type IX secretion system PorP/SprF family membrane protein